MQGGERPGSLSTARKLCTVPGAAWHSDTGSCLLWHRLAPIRCTGSMQGGHGLPEHCPQTTRATVAWHSDDLSVSAPGPCRVVTGYQNIARKFFAEKGFEHVVLLSADGEIARVSCSSLLRCFFPQPATL